MISSVSVVAEPVKVVAGAIRLTECHTKTKSDTELVAARARMVAECLDIVAGTPDSVAVDHTRCVASNEQVTATDVMTNETVDNGILQLR